MNALRLCLYLVAWALGAPAAWGQPASVQLESMTWTELRARVAAGATIALVPIGGTEQSGPHMALGKHNQRARLLAERIAAKLGNAIVAPVVAYVPEGTIEPPSEHMRWSGTVSIPAPAFEATLEAAARSLQRAGLRDVVLLGDHGGYRRSLERVAARVAHVHALPEYYRAATGDFARLLRQRGFTEAEIGQHAGLADTALTLALDPSLVREDAMRTRDPLARADGVEGDPRRASAELGKIAVDHIVEASVAAIRDRTRR